MKNLIKKIFGKGDDPKIEMKFNADEIKPTFETLGIDIETIGFPMIDERKKTHPLDNFWIHFNNITIKPIKVGEKLAYRIGGNYSVQAQCNHKDESGIWTPGEVMKYAFEISSDEGKLKIIKTN